MRLASRIGAVAGAVVLAANLACSPPQPPFNGTVVDPPAAAPQIAGVNWDGTPFRLGDLQGKVAVVFFGYTFCPDVCPLTLAKMKMLYESLGERAGDVAVVFLSVDPTRDTVEKLASYVPNFDSRFYGVRLDDDQIQDLTESFDLAVQYSQPQQGPGSDTYYYVDHTGNYFVIDREGMLRLTFPPNAGPETILPDIERLLAG